MINEQGIDEPMIGEHTRTALRAPGYRLQAARPCLLVPSVPWYLVLRRSEVQKQIGVILYTLKRTNRA